MCEFFIYLDNIIFSLQKAGGISVYWIELTQRLVDSTNRLVIFENGTIKNDINKRLINHLSIRRERKLFPGKIKRYLPLQARLEEPSVFHSSYYRISNQRNVANIVTAYDFIYERFRRGLPKLLHSWQKRFALRRADGIICISESTKMDLLHWFPELRKKNIRVIYLGVSEAFQALSDTHVDDGKIKEILSTKYIVFVGARTAAYKNFDIAVDVVGKLADYKLLIVGGGELSSNELSKLKEKLSGRYWHYPGIDETLLNIFYNNAICLLYPSSCEGFGIPIIEAMSSGCPVVAMNVTSIPETCGHAGLLVDKPASDNFIKKIRMLENESFRKEIILKGLKRASRFSWDKCHNQTKEFYQNVFHEKFGIPLKN